MRSKEQKLWEAAEKLGIYKPSDEELERFRIQRNLPIGRQGWGYNSTIKHRFRGPIDEQSGFGRKRRRS